MHCKDLLSMEQLKDSLHLVAGEQGLGRSVRWIYFADCIECVKDQDNLAQWIHGGELVIVTNDVFSDGGSLTYDESTREYVKNLAEINCALAREAATVTEVVCGIPVIIKKNHPMGK